MEFELRFRLPAARTHSHTHTHIHILNLSLSLSLSLTHTHTHTHAHKRTHTQTHRLTDSHKNSHTFVRTPVTRTGSMMPLRQSMPSRAETISARDLVLPIMVAEFESRVEAVARTRVTRAGSMIKVHRLLYRSTVGLREIQMKKKLHDGVRRFL